MNLLAKLDQMGYQQEIVMGLNILMAVATLMPLIFIGWLVYQYIQYKREN